MKPLTDDELLARAEEADNEFRYRTALAFRELLAARKDLLVFRKVIGAIGVEYDQLPREGCDCLVCVALNEYYEATR